LKISIAVPDSALSDEPTKVDKSRKISFIARACAVFKVDTIFIYEENKRNSDLTLFSTILKYLETPPFLRKQLFSKINELKFAGVLHPLKIPSHLPSSNFQKIQTGDIREGAVIIIKGKKFIDFGLHKLIPYYGPKETGKRITAQFKKGFPELVIKEIDRDDVSQYWGYHVKERKSLSSLLESWQGKIVLTSRKGKIISKNQLAEISYEEKPILIVFGSTKNEIQEILGGKLKHIQNSKILNFFPNQATETVRIEEAIMGTLSILNLASAN